MKRTGPIPAAIALLLLAACSNPEPTTPATGMPVTQPDSAKAGRQYPPADLDAMGINPFDTLNNAAMARELDSILSNCQAQPGASSVIASSSCFNEARAVAEEWIGKVYNQLYQQLGHKDRQALQKTQQDWWAYYKREETFLTQAYHSGDSYGHGREHDEVKYQWLFQIARQRYIALKVYGRQVVGPEEEG